MKQRNMNEIIKAKERIREIYKEMQFAYQIIQYYTKDVEQPLTHPNDILMLENAKTYEVFLNEELREPYELLLGQRGFPISFDKN